MPQTIDTIVVGAGQAGVAMSEHLGRAGISHLVLERARIAERWRSERWDSLVANGPAWHDRFPGLEFPGGPDDFVPKDAVADYFVDYARKIDAPVRCGVEVKRVSKLPSQRGFLVETSHGDYEALNVVAATGPFQKPVIPAVIDDAAPVMQMHSSGYKNPAQLPEGAVLVVGAGSSGVQIADELNRAGRKVFLSVGPHDRPPRAYRGRDFVWWLGVLGLWDLATPPAGAEHVTIAVSGARGGETIDFRRLAGEGITLLGRTEGYASGKVSFLGNIAQMVKGGDDNYLALLDAADAYVARNGLDLPEEPEARVIRPDPECMTHPITELDLAAEGIGTILWATGFVQDYSWIEAPTFDAQGRPIHRRGVSEEPGIYFLGLPWQSRRGSSFIWGVWHDAKHVADQIAIRHAYFTYHDDANAQAAPAAAQG
ncbi:NAD(P)/FAD-dependent oxidoreductase [Salipiger sp. 1_MG-2023]|uniref:flavin-containing monooxygenase n=1 Tax=Salipiger sp. 1_MG-2023 TaxID=3062665 RepID=UPI0026E2B9C7|nr:NAD(P)/FAD-dependent oxidoreductase [Salipiger sp. 1_MG-2023]MDO6584051.1 NAD(P)/FAD-dependent oxidoreductase [Salipiger sp. 1_MG-2023]